jgi:predicted alpha/beta-hydrolase family hydrolase
VTFLVAPGAGTSAAHPGVSTWVTRLGRIGPAVSFDYPYRRAGRGRPDPQAVLVAAHTRAVEDALGRFGGPVVCVGRSMGGRIGCHAAVEGAPIAGLVCLGYPLHGNGDPGRPRDAVLVALRTPVLFVQGTRDAMCPPHALEAVRARMSAPSRVFFVEGADHGLGGSLKALGRTADEVADAVEAEIQDLVARLPG